MRIRAAQSIAQNFYFALLFFVPSQFAQADTWADYHGTSTTTGIDSGARYNAVSSLTPPLSLLWSQANWAGAGNAIEESSPAVANGIVYVGSWDGKLYAWDVATGAAAPGFPVSAGGSIASSPAIANGIVYVGSQDQKLYAWNASTGAPISGFPVSTGNSILTSSPVVVNGIVYVGNQSNNLYAWNATTGASISGFPVVTGGPIYASPAIANGIVYVGAGLNLYAFDATTGANVPGFPVSTAGSLTIYSSPAVANGIVYIGEQNNLYAWNAVSGASILGFPVNTGGVGQILSSPAVANGIVYVGSNESKLHAWDASTASIISGFPVVLAAPAISSPAVANGFVYVGDLSNTLYVIDASNGAIAWQYTLPSNISPGEGFDRCSPAIADNKVFVSTDEGNGIFVFAFATPTISPTVTTSPTVSPTFSVSGTSSPTPTHSPTFTATPPPLCLQLYPASPNPSQGFGQWLPYHLCADAEVSITVYTVSGEVVRHMGPRNDLAGIRERFWDNRNADGQLVASGIFIYRVRAVSPRGEVDQDLRKCAVVR